MAAHPLPTAPGGVNLKRPGRQDKAATPRTHAEVRGDKIVNPTLPAIRIDELLQRQDPVGDRGVSSFMQSTHLTGRKTLQSHHTHGKPITQPKHETAGSSSRDSSQPYTKAAVVGGNKPHRTYGVPHFATPGKLLLLLGVEKGAQPEARFGSAKSGEHVKKSFSKAFDRKFRLGIQRLSKLQP